MLGLGYLVLAVVYLLYHDMDIVFIWLGGGDGLSTHFHNFMTKTFYLNLCRCAYCKSKSLRLFNLLVGEKNSSMKLFNEIPAFYLT